MGRAYSISTKGPARLILKEVSVRRAIGLTALVLVVALPAAAFGQISNTPHNLNNWEGLEISTPRGVNQVCLPCHVPHNAYYDAGTITQVLWNHEETDVTFEMYTTGSGQQGDQPEGPSKMCLSCHDGVTAIDSWAEGRAQSAKTAT